MRVPTRMAQVHKNRDSWISIVVRPDVQRLGFWLNWADTCLYRFLFRLCNIGPALHCITCKVSIPNSDVLTESLVHFKCRAGGQALAALQYLPTGNRCWAGGVHCARSGTEDGRSAWKHIAYRTSHFAPQHHNFTGINSIRPRNSKALRPLLRATASLAPAESG